MTKTEIMKVIASGRAIESFQYVPENGPEVNYNITALRKGLEHRPSFAEVVHVPMDQCIDFMRKNRIWEMQRCKDLTMAEYMNDPAIALTEGEGEKITHCFVDGVHRIIRRHMEGLDTVLVWVLPEKYAPRVDGNFVASSRFDWGMPLDTILKR